MDLRGWVFSFVFVFVFVWSDKLLDLRGWLFSFVFVFGIGFEGLVVCIYLWVWFGRLGLVGLVW